MPGATPCPRVEPCAWEPLKSLVGGCRRFCRGRLPCIASGLKVKITLKCRRGFLGVSLGPDSGESSTLESYSKHAPALKRVLQLHRAPARAVHGEAVGTSSDRSYVSQERRPQALPGNFHSSPTVKAEEICGWLKLSFPSRARSALKLRGSPKQPAQAEHKEQQRVLSSWVGSPQSSKAMGQGGGSGDYTRKTQCYGSDQNS